MTGENGKDLVNRRRGIAMIGRRATKKGKGKENQCKLIYGIHGKSLTILKKVSSQMKIKQTWNFHSVS